MMKKPEEYRAEYYSKDKRTVADLDALISRVQAETVTAAGDVCRRTKIRNSNTMRPDYNEACNTCEDAIRALLDKEPSK